MPAKESVICDICGNKFVPKFFRKFRPQRFCSEECRNIHKRQYMYDYQRKQRKQFHREVFGVIQNAHSVIRGSSFKGEVKKTLSGTYDPRIDNTHDGIDFIPSRFFKGSKCYNKIGTVSDRDLSIVKNNGQARIRGMMLLEKKGYGKQKRKE